MGQSIVMMPVRSGKMENWRPKDWRCPYLGKKANRYFELGADAILKALV